MSGSWRRLADAPHGIPDHVPDAFVNGHLYLTVGTRLLDYDVESDAWVQVDAPSDVEWRDLVVVGDKLVLPSGSDESGVHPDRVFDPSSGEWSTLPDDPIGPAFDRGLTATGSGAVLTGKELVPNPGADGPALVLAARLDEDLKTWHRLPDSDQLGGWAWGWTGERLVDPTPGGADGGEIGNYGRTVPYGGILDPATGQWSRLPDAPKEGSGGWPVDAHHGPLFATGGWLYDDEAGSWTRLPRAVDGPESPGSAAFMGGRLLVVGGIDWDAMEGELSPHAWVYAPAQRVKTIFPKMSPFAMAAKPWSAFSSGDRAVDERLGAGRVEQLNQRRELGSGAHRRPDHAQLQEEDVRDAWRRRAWVRSSLR